jgi:3-oxoadipate enol-lactonase / 4-carboxymuconolactone decarboxylase
MSTRLVTSDDTRIAFELTGAPNGQPLVFLHSLGSDRNQWRPQIDDLSGDFRILEVDTRGFGQSDAPTGPYTLERLATDVIELADMAGFDTFHLCGLSLGGMMAQWIAINHPHRLRTLTLANTAAKIGAAEVWNERAETARAHGVGSMVDVILARWFLPPFAARNPELIASLTATLSATSAAGYAGACAALGAADLRNDVSAITAKTLLIAASDDGATPPSDLEYLHTKIAGSRYHFIQNAAHISNLEAPEEFTRELRAHLQS